ncbi:MAG: arginase family protein [Candidatus Dormibacteraceae bacterium]
MPPALTALLCRTSDYGHGAAEGAAALAAALGDRWGVPPRSIGEVQEGRRAHWRDDLRAAAVCLREAGQRVADDLEAGRSPVLFSGHCPPCMATLPQVLRHLPECRVLWIDAHPDFNSPQTTPSDFLGGMCLAAACGLWESGFGGDLPGAQVVVTDGRDVDPGERVLLEEAGVALLEPSRAAGAIADHDVFIHLDLDVLDPACLPGLEFPAPGGLDLAGLEALLRGVVERARLVGIEITDCSSAGAVPAIAGALDRGLARAFEETAG